MVQESLRQGLKLKVIRGTDGWPKLSDVGLSWWSAIFGSAVRFGWCSGFSVRGRNLIMPLLCFLSGHYCTKQQFTKCTDP